MKRFTKTFVEKNGTLGKMLYKEILVSVHTKALNYFRSEYFQFNLKVF